ncbi:MAG: carbohydrate porin [Rhizobiaceae bacterium]
MTRQNRNLLSWSTVLSAAAILLWQPVAVAQEPTDNSAALDISVPDVKSGFDGPSSVSGTIAEDASARKPSSGALDDNPFRGWFAFKARVTKEHGFTPGFDYTALYQHYSSSPVHEKNAVGGIARAFGTWAFAGRQSGNTTSVTYKIENRHRIGTNLAPQDAGIAAGSTLPTGTAFSDGRNMLTNLFFQQRLAGGKVSLQAGIIDVTDFLDIYGMVSPWQHFQNLAFLTSPAISAPNPGLGIAGGAMLTPNVYVIGSFADANGDPTFPTNPFDSFFNTAEYFKSVEIGWTSEQGRIYLDNVHLTYWHADERKAAGVEESDGVAFNASWFVNGKWLPFLRAGYSRGTAAPMKKSIAAGLGLRRANKDVAGFSIAWGDPSVSALRNQTTAEVFYRWQINDVMAITPSLQLIHHPALDPTNDNLVVIGLRVRNAL